MARHDEDLRGHPDRAENERAGFSRFCAVREVYEIAPGGILLSRGDIKRWYAPIAHPELPQMVAKLEQADEKGLVGFAETYGALGFTWLTPDPMAAFYTWPDGRRTAGGDPLDWMRSHGRAVKLCLELMEALNKHSAKDVDRITGCRTDVVGDHQVVMSTPLRLARLAEIDGLEVQLNRPPFDRARTVLADVINSNIALVHRALALVDGTEHKSFFVYRAMIEAVYWHLANAVEGGIVARCKRPGCGALFIQRHRSQEYCAPRWNQRESPCALWVRQRRLTGSALQRIATEVKTRGQKSPQVRVTPTKNARQSPQRTKRA